jgi:adenosine deaminase
MVELARRNGVALPTTDLTELYSFDSLDGFLRVFWLGQSSLARREDWTRLAYESVVDGSAHGVVYRESFFTPARHCASGQALGDIVAGLDEGLSAGEAQTGARYQLIADMDRAFGPEAGLELVRQLARAQARQASSA